MEIEAVDLQFFRVVDQNIEVLGLLGADREAVRGFKGLLPFLDPRLRALVGPLALDFRVGDFFLGPDAEDRFVVVVFVLGDIKREAAERVAVAALPQERPGRRADAPDGMPLAARDAHVVKRNKLGVGIDEIQPKIQNGLGVLGHILELLEAEGNMPLPGIHGEGRAGFVVGGEDELAVLRFERSERNGLFLSPRARRHVKTRPGVFGIEDIRGVPARVGERLAVGRESQRDIPTLDRLRARSALAGLRGSDFRRLGRLAGGEQEKPRGGEKEERVFHFLSVFSF